MVLFLPAVLVVIYIIAINRHSTGMTIRQKLLKAFYPVLSGIGRITGSHNRVISGHAKGAPTVSLYSLDLLLNTGEKISLSKYRGKKLLLVNTASDCGYTPQFAELQALYEKSGDSLEIIGFPANDFKEQEKGSDQEIAAFCQRNYGVSFPLAAKCSVVKGQEQHPVFAWLSDPAKNGWNHRAPLWNFTKYLLNEKGELTHYMEPAVGPGSPEVAAAIQQASH